jgi:hypothetical protein
MRAPRGTAARRFRFARALLAVALVGVATAAVTAARIVRVTPLARDGQILVSFQMADAFTPEIQDAIASGLTTSFTYDIDLRRGTPLWVDRTIASSQVSVSVRFDNLTRRYHLATSQDGRVEAAQTTEDEGLVRTWMTEFERLPVFSTRELEPNTEYYVRVRAQARPRSSSLFVPFWGRFAAYGFAKFTFLP